MLTTKQKVKEIDKSNSISQDDCNTFLGNSSIYGIAHWVPDKVKTVDEIEADIKAFPGSTLELNRRVGLEETRVSDEDQTIVDMSMKAIEELKNQGTFNNEKIQLDEIDLIIYCGVCREYDEPSTSILIQQLLGLSGIMAFDVSNACLGFSDAWCIADSMIACGKVKNALIVSAEKGSCVSDKAISHINSGGDIMNQFASLTLGDGAVAILIGDKNSKKKGINLVSGIRKNYSQFNDLCILKNTSGIMESHPKPMFAAALERFPVLVNSVLESIEWEIDDIDEFVTHQVSVPAIKKGADIFGIPYPKVVLTFPEYGNIASVSLPLTLSVASQNKEEWAGQRTLVIGFGSGIGISAFALEMSTVS